MAIDPTLDHLSREELIVRARALGARRPEVMTRVELRDEIVRLGESDPTVRRRTRGWLGVARDLVASVVDSGLNLPGAAAAIRGEAKPEHEWQGPPPVATVTLAEIYVAQGHTDRALAVLAEVLASEPDHAAALALRDRLERRGEPQRVPSAARIAPEKDDVTPGRPVSLTAAGAPREVVVEAPPTPPEVPPPMPEAPPPMPEAPPPPAEELPPQAPAAVAAEETAPADVTPSEPAPVITDEPNPFPDEPSPLTADHSILPPEAAPYVEEPTIRGVINLLPERPACAVVSTSHGVEAFYELPATASDAVLRVVWFTPGPGGLERGERDLPVEPGYHRVAVEGVSPRSEVRAALGVPGATGFSPLAVAWVYQPGAGAPKLAFAPPGQEPATLRARVDARVVALR